VLCSSAMQLKRKGNANQAFREIIDESDVFIDVHKAIRRINPVAWYRIPKTIDEEHVQSPLTNLEAPALERSASLASETQKLLSPSDAGAKMVIPPKKTTGKLLRRKSSGGTESLTVQTSNAVLREHLKHLGPSNLASRPKENTITSVKIKPGQGTGVSKLGRQVLFSNHTESDLAVANSGKWSISSEPSGGLANRGQPESVDMAKGGSDHGTSETAVLLNAGIPASDAVHAVGYGSIGTPTAKTRNLPEQVRSISVSGLHTALEAVPTERPREEEDQLDLLTGPDPVPTTSAGKRPYEYPDLASLVFDGSAAMAVAAKMPASQNASTPSTPTMPAKLVVSHEHEDSDGQDDEDDKPDENSSGSTVPSMRSAGTSNTAVRTGVRSGSIMERDIDLDGVRKIVIEVDEGIEERTDGEENGKTAHLEVKKPGIHRKHSKAESSKKGGPSHPQGEAEPDAKEAKKKKRKKRVTKKSKKNEPEGGGVSLS
jgi:metal transporter CNNM